MRKREELPVTKNTKWARRVQAAQYFNVGVTTFDKLAAESEAKVCIGRTVVYNIEKVENYLESLTG